MPEAIWTIPRNSIRTHNVMKQFSKIFIVIGILSVAYGAGVVSIIGVSHWFDFASVVAGVGIIAFVFLAPSFKILPKRIKQGFLFVLILALCIFGLTEMRIITEGQELPLAGADYIIVLGAKVEGENPSFALARRIEAAAEYMLANPSAIALATGGRGADEMISEGNAIANGLCALGIEQSRILVENKSTSTKENLFYALNIINKNGGSSKSRIVIVSSGYHIFRAKKLAEMIGYQNVSAKGCQSMPYLAPHYYAREFAALIKEKLDGNI